MGQGIVYSLREAWLHGTITEPITSACHPKRLDHWDL